MVERISQTTLTEVKETANDRIDYVLSALGIDVNAIKGFAEEIRCKCPIHDGDNESAFCYNTKFKQWRCYTGRCHEGHTSIIGLTQKLLSKNENREVGFREAVFWLAGILNLKIEGDTGEVNIEQQELHHLIRQAKIKNNIHQERSLQNNKNTSYPFPVSKIDGKVEPSWYFLNKGFNRDILIKYNIGYCDKPEKPMYLRSYAPVLDEAGKMVIGATGRICYEQCEYCPLFHAQGKGCPKDNPRVRGYPKWFHDGFKTSSTLYNSWFAEPFVKKSGVAIVLESPKDVWWLEQHGLHNSVCIFGLSILSYHLTRLIKMGTTTVVVALDNDEAGLEAIESVNNNFANYFKIINISNKLPDGYDISDISSEETTKLVPFIKSLERK